ncbi:MAG TPA: hypothetical protein VKY37_09665 [Brumimicrobium sp.]|nr:hypothetical protein [Brumimicrobium sp.]
MDKRYLIAALMFVFTSISTLSTAQYSLGGGLSSFHGVNLPISRVGVNFFAEVPRTPENTLFIRAAYMLPNSDSRSTFVSGKQGVTPSMTEADLVAKTSYFAIDGGTRYYLFNQYDIGFAVFAGGHIKGILSSYSARYRMPGSLDINDYETSDFPAQPLTGLSPQYSLLFAFGGNVGVKYQLPMRGALTFDFALELITRLYDPYTILGNDIAPLSFSFNLGYRFDWY